MKTILEQENYNIVSDPNISDIIVVNTCGFIDAAKEESIGEILSMARVKESGGQKLLVSGCLAERYPDELYEEIPEIDGIIGTGQIRDIDHYIALLEEGRTFKETGKINRPHKEGLFKSNVKHVEYVKISEGCNNNCSYCIIPQLRGKNRSRRIEDIYQEVEYLVDKGAKEIVLIAQNTTDYGIDLYGKYSLAELVRQLEDIEGLKWIRLLYLYPDNFGPDLIQEFQRNKKLLPYVDIPLQHVSDKVLKAMNRRTNKEMIEDLLIKLRKDIPGIIIRSTFIVGFPGEDQRDLEELLDFLKEYRLDKVGVFTYSKEESTPAYRLEGQISQEEKVQRRNQVMALQAQISEENLSQQLGREYKMIIDEVEDNLVIGRTYMDTIDIDGLIFINGNYRNLYRPGDFVDIKITDTMEYDMVGEIL